jgi:hypothetical protein
MRRSNAERPLAISIDTTDPVDIARLTAEWRNRAATSSERRQRRR